MELNGLVPILKRWAAVILVATAVAAGVGLFLGAKVDKTYEARALMLVGPLSTDTNTMRASGDLAQTYAELATTSRVLSVVSTSADVPQSELTSGVRATANSATRLLSVRARSNDPKTAAAVANGVTTELVALGAQDPTRPEGQLRIIDPAGQPGSPISPRLGLIVPLATVAGLLGSMTLVLLFEFVGDTLESADKVQDATGLTTIAVKRGRLRPGRNSGKASDPMRIVATQTELAAPSVRCILVTGVMRRDGTGGFALELARVLGERHRSVTVIDAGVGEVSRLTEQIGEDGLHEVLADRDSDIGLHPLEENLAVIGTGRGRGAEAIEPADAAELVDQLTADGGVVVVHAPPATISAATLVWAQTSEVTIVVVRRFQARRTAIVDVTTNLRVVGAPMPFAVLHDEPRQPWRRTGSSPSTGQEKSRPAEPKRRPARSEGADRAKADDEPGTDEQDPPAPRDVITSGAGR